MKDIIKLLAMLIPVIKDLVNSADNEISTGKKRRILKIMGDQDLTKLEKLERILFRKSKVKVEILGYIKNDHINSNEKIASGVVVNERLVEHYYHLASQKVTKGD